MSNIVLLFWVFVQSVLIVAAQTFLKKSVELFGAFSWTWEFFKTALTTWQFYVSGLFAVSSVAVWMYVLKYNDLGLAYPLMSISYIVALFAACFILGETVPITRWIGVVIVMIGVFFILK